MLCPNCNAEVKVGMAYCGNCGTSFSKSKDNKNSSKTHNPSYYTRSTIESRLKRGNKFAKLNVHGSALDEYLLAYDHYQTYVEQYQAEVDDLKDLDVFLEPENLFNPVAIDSINTVLMEGGGFLNDRRDEAIKLLEFAGRQDLIDMYYVEANKKELEREKTKEEFKQAATDTVIDTIVAYKIFKDKILGR